jgi:hypothetical protein
MDAGAICPDGNCSLIKQGPDGQLYQVTAEIILSASFSKPVACDANGCTWDDMAIWHLTWHDWMGIPSDSSGGYWAFALPWYPKGLGGRYPPDSGPTLQKPPINPLEPPPVIEPPPPGGLPQTIEPTPFKPPSSPPEEIFGIRTGYAILRGLVNVFGRLPQLFLVTPCANGELSQYTYNGQTACPQDGT